VRVAASEVLRDTREHCSRGQQIAAGQFLADPIKDAPQHLSLVFRQPGLAPQAGHVAISLPAIQLPGIHDLTPLRPEEMVREAVGLDAFRRIRQHPANRCVVHEPRSRNASGAESSPHILYGIDLDPLKDAGLIANKPLKLDLQRIGEGVREGGKQKPCIPVLPGQTHRAMQGDDRLARPGRA